MAKPIVYAVGAVGLAAVGWLIFGNKSAQAANTTKCTGVQDLNEPLRSQVVAALANPASTADSLNNLATTLDAVCPGAAAQVRAAAMQKVVAINPPQPPPPKPPPYTRPDGCAPITPQVITTDHPGNTSLGEIAQAVTGNINRWPDLLPLNADKPGIYEYAVRFPVMDDATGAITHQTRVVGLDHYVQPTVAGILVPGINAGMPTAGSSAGAGKTFMAPDQVTIISASYPQGTPINLPKDWNKYFQWSSADGAFLSHGDGSTHSACAA